MLTRSVASSMNRQFEGCLTRQGSAAQQRQDATSSLLSHHRAESTTVPGLNVLEPGFSLAQTRRRPQAWSASRVKALAAKNKKAAARRKLHTARLRACMGQPTILETIGLGDAITKDYQTHLVSFWDFCDRWRLPTTLDRQYDVAMCDWADFEFLDGEGPFRGDKLLAALEKHAVENTSAGAILVPRFRRVLR